MQNRPSPQPSQPKSDISDFGHSIRPNSGKPEFGCKRGEGAHRVCGAALLAAALLLHGAAIAAPAAKRELAPLAAAKTALVPFDVPVLQ